MKPVKAVIPAGGYSSRLAPHFKPLVQMGQRTLVKHMAETCLESGMSVIVVAGYRGEEVAHEVRDLPIEVVMNHEFEKGMFSSIICGLERAGDETPVMILPVDHPLIKVRILRVLIDVKRGSPEKIVIPVCQGKRGHPVILPRWILPLVKRLSPDTPGLRVLWPLVEHYIEEVPVDDQGVLFNLNQLLDLETFKEWLKEHEIL